MDIRSFDLAAQTLWTEQDVLFMSMLPPVANAAIHQERHRSLVMQFLMKLRPEFKAVRSQLMSSNTVDMDMILGDLVRAETRYRTQAQMDGRTMDVGTVFAAHRSNYHSPSPRESHNAVRPSYSFPRPQFGARLHDTYVVVIAGKTDMFNLLVVAGTFVTIANVRGTLSLTVELKESLEIITRIDNRDISLRTLTPLMVQLTPFNSHLMVQDILLRVMAFMVQLPPCQLRIQSHLPNLWLAPPTFINSSRKLYNKLCPLL
ncbi:hypothetical protein LINPERHAP2_LOCUS13118 [Linum perenne]